MRRSLLVVSVLLSACLGPRQDPSAFFMLSPGPAAPQGAAVPVVLGLGPVTIPGYLDRPQIVVRLSDYEITLADADRWAEPLVNNITRTMEADLASLLPGSSYVDFPWFESEAPDYAITVEIRRFEADSSGRVILDAGWQLLQAGTAVSGRSARIEGTAGGPGRAASVAAQSQALAELSVEIAAAVRAAWSSR